MEKNMVGVITVGLVITVLGRNLPQVWKMMSLVIEKLAANFFVRNQCASLDILLFQLVMKWFRI